MKRDQADRQGSSSERTWRWLRNFHADRREAKAERQPCGFHRP